MAHAPQIGIEKRRFRNVAPEIHGAVILDADNRAKGVPVMPGELIWLSAQEEQLTAEAPVREEDNPFVKEWQEPVAFDQYGNPTSFVPRHGVLVAVDDKPRIIGSQRFTPTGGDPNLPQPPAGAEAPSGPEVTAEVPPEEPPPATGQGAADEEVATPSAREADRKHAAATAAAKTVDRGGIEWEQAGPKGAPAKDNPASRKPVAG